MLTSSAIITTLYLGGWQVPFVHDLGLPDFWVAIIQIGGFCLKVLFLILFFIVIRWTIPRFRYDQLMNLGWKVMLPLAILNLLLTGIAVVLLQ